MMHWLEKETLGILKKDGYDFDLYLNSAIPLKSAEEPEDEEE